MSMASTLLAPTMATPTYSWRGSTCTTTRPQVGGSTTYVIFFALAYSIVACILLRRLKFKTRLDLADQQIKYESKVCFHLLTSDDKLDVLVPL